MDHLRRTVLPERQRAAEKEAAQNAEGLAANPKSAQRRHHSGFLDYWWMHAYRRADMLEAIKPLDRYIATARVASGDRRPVFTFLDTSVRPADKVVVDDWDQCNREGKIIHQLTTAGRFSRERLHAELGQIVIGDRPGRENDDEVILLNSMGMAVIDVACAKAVYDRARQAKIGTWLPR